MYKVVVVEDEKRVRQGIIMGTDWSKINCVVMGEAANLSIAGPDKTPWEQHA